MSNFVFLWQSHLHLTRVWNWNLTQVGKKNSISQMSSRNPSPMYEIQNYFFIANSRNFDGHERSQTSIQPPQYLHIKNILFFDAHPKIIIYTKSRRGGWGGFVRKQIKTSSFRQRRVYCEIPKVRLAMYVFTQVYIYSYLIYSPKPAGYAKKLETIYGWKISKEKRGKREWKRAKVPEKSAYFIPRVSGIVHIPPR